MRARRTPKVTRTDNPTASKARESFAATVPLVIERWGTIALGDKPVTSVCVWGEKQTAIEGRDPDERVCRLRIEVLEILDENR